MKKQIPIRSAGRQEDFKMVLEYSELTEKIIGAAIAVHRALGAGFLESVYENAMTVELRQQGIPFDQQLEVPVFYKREKVGQHRLDLLVEKSIVVELKTVTDFEDIHFSVVRSYLRALDLKHGLLINFAKSRIEVKRVMVRDE